MEMIVKMKMIVDDKKLSEVISKPTLTPVATDKWAKEAALDVLQQTHYPYWMTVKVSK